MLVQERDCETLSEKTYLALSLSSELQSMNQRLEQLSHRLPTEYVKFMVYGRNRSSTFLSSRTLLHTILCKLLTCLLGAPG